MNAKTLIESIVSHAESLCFSAVQDEKRSVILGGHTNSRCKIIFHIPEFTKVLMIYLRSPKNYREIMVDRENNDTAFELYEVLIELAQKYSNLPSPSKREFSQRLFLTDTFIMEQINSLAQDSIG